MCLRRSFFLYLCIKPFFWTWIWFTSQSFESPFLYLRIVFFIVLSQLTNQLVFLFVESMLGNQFMLINRSSCGFSFILTKDFLPVCFEKPTHIVLDLAIVELFAPRNSSSTTTRLEFFARDSKGAIVLCIFATSLFLFNEALVLFSKFGKELSKLDLVKTLLIPAYIFIPLKTFYIYWSQSSFV